MREFEPQKRPHPARDLICAMATLALAACADPQAQPVAVAQLGSGLFTATAPTTADACPETRMVGLDPTPATNCPSSTDPNWQLKNLFPYGAASPELRNYCAYDWVASGSPTVGTLPKAGHPSPRHWLTADCQVVAPFSHPYERRNAAMFETAFLDQVQALAAPPVGGGHPTKVIVADTAPGAAFPFGTAGRAGHGRAMSALVRRLACPQNGRPGTFCGAEVATEVALPMIRTPTGHRADLVNGGFFGRFTDIASAVHLGLHRGLARGTASGIIINLSLGWDGRWGGEIPATGWQDLPPPVRAVYSALAEARCRQALVIAATGNDAGGPDRTLGAAYPAAWESEPAPDAPRCAPLGGGGSVPGALHNPLVFGVGGVDGADQTLINARPGDAPRIVAPAAHMSVSQGPHYQSPLYSGSSVAAAVATSAAAMAWTYQPWLNAEQVMDLVHGRAVSLGSVNCVVGVGCFYPPRRVSVCRTVEAACAGGVCTAPVCAPSPAFRDARAHGFSTAGVPAPPSYTMTSLTRVTPGLPCTRDIVGATAATTTFPCPSSQLYSAYASPFSGPQPGPRYCPSCSMINSDIHIGIDAAITDHLSNPVLVVSFTSGGDAAYTIEGVGTLSGGDTVDVHMDNVDSNDLAKATIEFINQDGLVVSDTMHLEN